MVCFAVPSVTPVASHCAWSAAGLALAASVGQVHTGVTSEKRWQEVIHASHTNYPPHWVFPDYCCQGLANKIVGWFVVFEFEVNVALM